jgi:hypothetical protein
MEYKVIEANKALDLQEEVNRHIQEGWIPLGGVAVVHASTSNYWSFYQAMIKDGARAHRPRG